MTTTQRAGRLRFRANAEDLEERKVLSLISWTNQGQASDNFATDFGNNAATARQVVGVAIAEWESVIVNFNQMDGKNLINLTISANTSLQSAGAVTNVTSTYSDGKPKAATISIGRFASVSSTGVGTNWDLDSTLFSPAFLGSTTNAFASYSSSTAAGFGQTDLLQTVAHEVGHAMGFYANAQVDKYVTDTGVKDKTSYGTNSNGTVNYAGDYYVFNGPTGFSALLTSFNSTPNGVGQNSNGGEHFAAPGAQVAFNGKTYYGSDDLMNPLYQSGQRRLVSTDDVDVLRDAFGYTVQDPSSALGSFYSYVNPVTHTLTLTSRNDAASTDTFSIGTTSDGYITTTVGIGNPVPGTGYTTPYTRMFLASSVSNIVINTDAIGSSSSSIFVQATPANVTTTINAKGHDTAFLGNKANVQGILGQVSLVPGAYQTFLYINDAADSGIHNNITLADVPGQTKSGQITGLAPGTITYPYAGVYDVDLSTGTYTNTINVQAARTNRIDLEGHSAATTFKLGLNGSLSGITATPIISDTAGFGTLMIDDSNDAKSQTTTLVDAPGLVSSGQITGLAPATIIYQYAGLYDVYLKTGLGSNTVNVQDSRSNRVDLEGHSASTTVNIGLNGSLAGIIGGPVITNLAGGTALNIDDSTDTSDRNIAFTEYSFVPGYEYLSGLTAYSIEYQKGSLRSLSLVTGAGTPTGVTTVNASDFNTPTSLSFKSVKTNLNIQNVDFPTTITLGGVVNQVDINKASAATTINDVSSVGTTITTSLGDGTNNLILAPLTINGNGGSTHLIVSDAGINPHIPVSPIWNTLTTLNLNANSITRSGNVAGAQYEVINFQNLGYFGSLTVNPGLVFPTVVNVIGTSNAATTVNAGTATTGVDVGEGNTNGLGGGLALHDTSNNVTPITIDDSKDTAPRQIGLYSSASLSGNYEVTGLNSAGIYLDNSPKSLTVDTGQMATVSVHELAAFPLLINGNSSNTTLQGPDGFNTWSITGTGAGTFDTSEIFTGIRNLLGGAGNDTYYFIRAAGTVGGSIPGTLDGGAGRNALDYSNYNGAVLADLPAHTDTGVAGTAQNFQDVNGSASGDDILVGDGNSDRLTGGRGNNILIAGQGAARLIGGSGNNILIGGSTNIDLIPAALEAILSEWSRSDISYSVKVRHILNGGGLNGSTTLNASNVKSNGGGNSMIRNGTQDLFFGSTTKDSANPNPGDFFISI
jgi:hypothetical protein